MSKPNAKTILAALRKVAATRKVQWPTYPSPNGATVAACDEAFISEVFGLGVQFGTPGNREVLKALGFTDKQLGDAGKANELFEDMLCVTLGIKSSDEVALPDRKVLAGWGVPEKIVAMKSDAPAGKSRKAAEPAPAKKSAKIVDESHVVKPVATPKTVALDERFAGMATTAALILFPLAEALKEDYADNPAAAALAKRVATLSDDFAKLAGIE